MQQDRLGLRVCRGGVDAPEVEALAEHENASVGRKRGLQHVVALKEGYRALLLRGEVVVEDVLRATIA